jgi:hypothetical protein
VKNYKQLSVTRPMWLLVRPWCWSDCDAGLTQVWFDPDAVASPMLVRPWCWLHLVAGPILLLAASCYWPRSIAVLILLLATFRRWPHPVASRIPLLVTSCRWPLPVAGRLSLLIASNHWSYPVTGHIPSLVISRRWSYPIAGCIPTRSWCHSEDEHFFCDFVSFFLLIIDIVFYGDFTNFIFFTISLQNFL